MSSPGHVPGCICRDCERSRDREIQSGREPAAPPAREPIASTSDDLGARLEAVLGALYRPDRTRKDEVATRRGRSFYRFEDHQRFCARLVGLSVSEATLLELRISGSAPAVVYGAVRQAVGRLEAGLDVELLVRRDSFRMHARSGLSYFRDFGSAPDGDSSIRAWLDRLAVRVDALDVSLLELGDELDITEGQ